MFRVGDRVKTLPVRSYTDDANRLLANRDAVVTAIHYPFGLHTQYEIEFVEPFFDHGYEVKTKYYYDFDNALELIERSNEQVNDCNKTRIHTLSVVNSEGYDHGNMSRIYSYSNYGDFVDNTYSLYLKNWKESEDQGVLEDGEELLSKEAFEARLLKEGNLAIQCLDAYISFEYFAPEVTLDLAQSNNMRPSIDEQIRSAEARTSDKSNIVKTKALETEFNKCKEFLP